MKIGILTLPPYANYGGILQAYALQTVLEIIGHNVCVLANEHEFYKPTYIEYIKRIVSKILGRRTTIASEKKAKKEAPIVFGNLWNFIENHINIYKLSQFDDLENNVDAIVVGSDQIWRPQYFLQLWRCPIQNAFLSFSEKWKIKRIAYAASFGVDEWEYDSKQTQICKQYAKIFDSISVREHSAIGLLKKYFGVSSEFVLDPTMLLDTDDYIRLFQRKRIPTHKKGLLVYILDNSPRKREIINDFAMTKSLEVFSVTNTMVKETAPVEERIMPSVENWLKGFYDAEFVITDSFHACVFSILFRKPFVAIGNPARGMGRFRSLLETFGLESHLLIPQEVIDYSCDYSIPDGVYVKLENLRKKSLEFLYKSFSDKIVK